jgi:lantibiotic biosynthesis protein
MLSTYFSTAFVRVPLASAASIQTMDWDVLRQYLQQPTFLEALYIASPALYEEATKIAFGRQLDDKTKRVLYSVLKYLSRYATRCTPFGLFGGFATLPIGNAPTQVAIKGIEAPRKVARLDMNYLCALAQDLEKNPHIKPYLRFFPNTSLYQLNGQYRYVEYHYNAAGMREHQLSSADYSEYLQAVLDLAQRGATLSTLAQILVSDEITAEEAAEFVEQMVASQLLVSELEPALTGDDFLVQIQDTLAAVATQEDSEDLLHVQKVLNEVQTALRHIETSGEDYSLEKFNAVEDLLSQLPTPFDRKVLFQIDSYLPQAQGQLNRGLLNKLIAKIPTLMKLSPTGNATLEDFVSKFVERYEDEEVPLVLALDPEAGIGFPAGQAKGDASPIADGIGIGGTGSSSKTFTIPEQHQYLLQKVAEAQLTGAYQIDINEEDLHNQEVRNNRLPLTNTAMFSVIRENGREKILLSSFGGTTGTGLLGRFGHTDASVLGLLQEISQAEDEAAPEVIFADIVHLPEARTGNVIIRPQLKQYQIPYLSKASCDKDHEIAMTDLMISIRSNQVVLRSKSLNKIIVPRLSNAHNYSGLNSLDAYYFLCAVQSQSVRLGLSSFTQSFDSLFMFLPRLVLDGIILSEAQWNFSALHVKPLVEAFKKNQSAALHEALRTWRSTYKIPRRIALIDFDNELYLDLENEWMVEVFLNEIKSREQFSIKEFLHEADNAVVASERGWHTNQFVVAFKNEPETPITAPKVASIPNEAVERKFFVGSEWLYYKVYTGMKTADTLLTEVIYPLAEQFKAEGLIDRYFFIRYADPHHHIRVRFHFTDTQHSAHVIRAFQEALAPLVANKTISSVVNDTYNRELERYGHNSIEAVEDYFHLDSAAILQFLSMIEGAEGEECRWRFGVMLTHQVLGAFGYDLKARMDFCEKRAADFGREFGYNPQQRKQLDTRYKELEPALHELMAEGNPEHTFFYEICAQRSAQLQAVVEYLLELNQQGQLQLSLDDLLASLIHMNLNRLFRSQQRFVEYSVFYQLHKYYRAEYGRTVLAKKNGVEVKPAVELLTDANNIKQV